MNSSGSVSSGPSGQGSTLRTLARMSREGEAFACLTCYDATTATILERAGVHLLLVGDTAAEVVLGYPSTIHMPLDVSVALTAAVKRGAPGTVVMGDMPFLSYQGSFDTALANAGRYMTEGTADIVKLEMDRSHAELVRGLVRAGIPVCAHVGAKPQQVAVKGGYTAAGRTAEGAQAVVDDAVALEQAGASMLLIEAVPSEVAERVVEQTSVPVIGIGAGPSPHGQILVLQDVLGMTDWSPPFAPRLGAVGAAIESVASDYVRLVRERSVTSHRYGYSGGATESGVAR